MNSLGKNVIAGFTRPFLDLFRGLEHAVIPGPLSLLFVAAGLAVGWWVYVPVHELLHALACIATGGDVDELEIALAGLEQYLAEARRAGGQPQEPEWSEPARAMLTRLKPAG